MITELAALEVAAPQVSEFIQVFPEAQALLERAKGLESSRLLQDVDEPCKFVIEAHWDSLEDHVEGFIGSELFDQFAGIVGPFLTNPPVLRHFSVPAPDGE